MIWLRIKGNAFPDVRKVFRVRQDNGHKGWIDLEISSRPPKYMTDVKSGGTEYDFTKHIEHEWGRPAWTAPGTKGAGTANESVREELSECCMVQRDSVTNGAYEAIVTCGPQQASMAKPLVVEPCGTALTESAWA